MARDSVTPQGASTLAAEIFLAARSRQMFGVDWAMLNEQQKVDYVKNFLNREVWFHQREPIVRLTDRMTKRVTYNATRQCGKCLLSTSYITLNTGEIKQISELPTYTPIALATTHNHQVTTAYGIVVPSGVKPLIKSSYFAAECLVTTKDHRLFRRKTHRRWKDAPVDYLGYDYVEAGKQKPRDHIATVNNLEKLRALADYTITDNELKFLAYHLAEGSSAKSCDSVLGFSTASDAIAAEMDSIAFQLDTQFVASSKKSKATDYRYTRLHKEKEAGLLTRLRTWGLLGKDCYEKSIPNFLFKCSSRQIGLFLNRFFACDGYACLTKPNNAEIGVTLANRLMVSQLANLLRMLGISTGVGSTTRPCCYPDGSKKYFTHWTVRVTKSLTNYVRFKELVGIYEKERQLDACVALVGRQKRSSYRHEHSLEGDLRYAFFQEFVDAGEGETYDIQIVVPPAGADSTYEPNFIANGFVVHNSESMSWAQIICATHNTHPALDNMTKVIGLANKFSQTQIVGNRVRSLLMENYDRTQFFWDRDGSTKAHVVFKREAGINSKETGIIDYVTANPKAFSEGFTASIMFVDEANRLDARVYSEVLIPYLSSTAGTIVLTGVSRGKGPFYDACNSRDYIHLHYPWDAVETYRRSAPADIIITEDVRKEVGLYPLEVMPITLKRVWYPTNPMVHVLQTAGQRERWVRLWDLSEGSMSEEDFRSQYNLDWLADVLAFLQLQDQQLLFDSGEHEPLNSGRDGDQYFFGLDCGGSRNAYATTVTNKDSAALSVWRRNGHVKQKVYCDERDDVLPEELVAWLRETCHPQSGRFKCAFGTVDVTGAVGAFASQHLKDCGIPIIPIMYNRTEEITKKNFKNAIFEYFKLENSAGRTQYPLASCTDRLDELTLKAVHPTFFEHREQWEILERKLTTGVNAIITAPSGQHDDGPNSDALAVYGMDHPNLFQEVLNIKKRAKFGSVGRGVMSRGGPNWSR